MKIFHLPDLGEGLADAEIREWHVKVGDTVQLDDPVVCMETAKAVVEVPSPQAGRITKLYGDVGDVIATGAPLIEYEGAEEPYTKKDAGSVVGSLEESKEYLDESDVIIGSASRTTSNIKAMPAVRALAQQLQVDLANVTPSGAQGQITAEDVKMYANTTSAKQTFTEKLHGIRRTMSLTMTQSHQEIVPVTIIDDADISAWQTNPDVTTRLIQALVAGAKCEPSLNAWYDGKKQERQLFSEINLGIAMDTTEGLFVPVLKEVEKSDATLWRKSIDTFKQSVKARTVSSDDMQGATLILSNFGMIAGRYATPIVVPPMVAILGCGKLRDEVVAYKGEIAIRRILPLSLTFDHRAVTGGEATRFLAAVIQSLETSGVS